MRRARTTRRIGPAAAVGLALLVAACGDDDDAESTASEVSDDTATAGSVRADASTDEADRSATIRYAISFGHNSFDPHRSPFAGDPFFQRQVYDRLLTVAATPDGGMDLAPQLATSWEVADDGLSIEFELRDDVTFHDGATFDAEAVKANIERAQDPDSTVSSDLANLERVEVIDPTHVVFRLSEPDPSIPWNLAFGASGMMVSPDAFGADLAANPVGAGPFTLVSAQKDAEIVYERYDDYWDPDRPLAQRLVISTVSDAVARFNGVRTDGFDVAFMSPPYDSESENLETEGFTRTVTLDSNAYALILNTDMEPFDDARVRRAVYLAFDREEISETLLNGLQPPSYQPFQAGHLGYDAALDGDWYDPEEARALVSEAGAEGSTVKVVQTATEPQNSVAQIAQQALGDIGLNVELVPLSPTEARVAFNEGGFHGMASVHTGRPHPHQTLGSSYLDDGLVGTPPTELVEMADEARRLPVESAEAEAAYQEISRYLVENPVHVPIAQFANVHVCSPEVVGCETMLTTGTTQFHDVGLRAS